MLTNAEIVDIYLKSGLIHKCVGHQFNNLRDMYKTQFREDMEQDLVIILLEYDNTKLNNAHENKHMNALITRILINNLLSNTSRFYTTYIRRLPGKLVISIEEAQIKEDYDPNEKED